MESIKRNVRLGTSELCSKIEIPLISGGYLSGRKILVTGGGGGIGYSIAEACARNGASVVICGRNKERLEASAENISRITQNSCVYPHPLDIQNIQTYVEKLEEAEKLFGGQPDTLVNSAGVFGGSNLGTTAETDYDKVLDTNLKGTYFFTQAFSNRLISSGIQGNILNISSSSGVRPAISPYMLSKWGLIGLTEGLAKKLIRHGIVVNGIAPGPTATPMLKKDGSDLSNPKSMTGRYIAPEEVANLAVFLISSMGRMIVGDTIFMTGGAGTLTLDDVNY